MARRLFCEISPATCALSEARCRCVRHLHNLRSGPFARKKAADDLPYEWFSHRSLIRRKLGDVDTVLQDNKAENLALSAPKVDGGLIAPGETFSFWALVGPYTARRGYRDGLTICGGQVSRGVGGGMCQFSNLLHWLVLHSPLEIVEHHHHNGVDLFPDSGRRVPFGTGTAIMYNYLDYRFRNPTDMVFQLRVHTDGEYLCGRLLASAPPDRVYRVFAEDEHYAEEPDGIYRCSTVVRAVETPNGRETSREVLLRNHARILYDRAFVADRIRR